MVKADPSSRPLAAGVHRASVRLDETAHEGETETEPSARPARRSADAWAKGRKSCS